MSLLTEEIKRRKPILDLVMDLLLEPKKRGKHYVIKSIYKEENTPSLYIRPEQNNYHCFATGQGGDVIQFYQDFFNIEQTQAIKELANSTGINLSDYGWGNGNHLSPSVKPVKASSPEQPILKAFKSDLISSLSSEEKRFFIEQVASSMCIDPSRPVKITDEMRYNIKLLEPKIKRALQKKRLETNKIIFSELYLYCKLKEFDQSALLYLVNDRKLPKETLDRFKVFTINNYNEVNNHMKKVFSLQDLQKSGLYNTKEDGSGNLVFYNHRIIIPHMFNSEIVYLRGRYFDTSGKSKTDQAKYIGLYNDGLGLNSPKRFFNIDIWKKMLPKERLYLVEGEMDCLTIEAMGYNCSCIPGAGCIPDLKQFLKIKDFEIIWCGDNDPAGNKLLTGYYIDQNGAQRYSELNIVKIFEALGKKIKIKKLPTKDVNEFMVKNEQA